MDVRPTKNAIFIAIDPCLHLAGHQVQLGPPASSIGPPRASQNDRPPREHTTWASKKNVGSKYFQMIPSCPVILQHTAYYLTRSQLYLDLSMSNVTFLDLSIPFTTTAGHHFQVLTWAHLINHLFHQGVHIFRFERVQLSHLPGTHKNLCPPSASKSSIKKHHPLSSSWHADDPDGSTATFSYSMVSTCKHKTSFRRMEHPFPSIRTSYFDDFWCEHSHGFWFWPHFGISRDQPTWLWVFSSRCFRSSMSLACRGFAILWIWMGYSVIGYQWYQWYQWYQCSNLL